MTPGAANNVSSSIGMFSFVVRLVTVIAVDVSAATAVELIRCLIAGLSLADTVTCATA